MLLKPLPVIGSIRKLKPLLGLATLESRKATLESWDNSLGRVISFVLLIHLLLSVERVYGEVVAPSI